MNNFQKKTFNIINLIWILLITSYATISFEYIRKNIFTPVCLMISLLFMIFISIYLKGKYRKKIIFILSMGFIIFQIKNLYVLLLVSLIVIVYSLMIDSMFSKQFIKRKITFIDRTIISTSISLVLLIKIVILLLSLSLFSIYSISFMMFLPVIYFIWNKPRKLISGYYHEMKIKIQWLKSKFEGENNFNKTLIVTIVFFLLLVLCYSLAPEIMFDANKAHLDIAKNYSTYGNLNYYDTMSRYMPQNVIMLYTLFFKFFGEIGAKSINFIFLIISCLVVSGFCKSFCARKSILYSLILFISIPLVIWEGSTAYTDIGLLLFEIVALYMITLSIFKEENNKFYLILAGIFMGTALGIKYLTFYVIISFIITFLIFDKSKIMKKIQSIFYTGIISLIFGMFWYIRSYIFTKNPVFPFYNYIFKSELWLQNKENMNLGMFGMKKNIINFVIAPFKSIFSSSKFLEAPNGVLGIGLLMGLILIIIWIIKESKNKNKFMFFMISNIIIIYFLWFTSAQYLRYDIVIYPLICICSGEAINYCIENNYVKIIIVKLIISVTIILNISILGSVFWNVKDGIPYKYLTYKQNKEEYLSENLAEYDLYNFIDSNADAKYYMLSLSKQQYRFRSKSKIIIYFDRPIATDILINSKNIKESDLVDKFKKYNIQYIINDDNFKLIDYFNEDFIKKHFSIIYASISGNSSLYKINYDSKQVENNVNLIKNGSFEEVKDGKIEQWYSDNSSQIVKSNNAKKGEKYVKASVDKPIIQAIPINELKTYKFSIYSKYESSENRLTRLQINWMNKDKFINTSIKVIDSGKEWQKKEMLITAPKGANTAIVYVNSHEKYFVDFDDVEFMELK